MAEKASQNSTKSAEYDYDLFVIGGGCRYPITMVITNRSTREET